jgi:hypothetical protein
VHLAQPDEAAKFLNCMKVYFASYRSIKPLASKKREDFSVGAATAILFQT